MSTQIETQGITQAKQREIVANLAVALGLQVDKATYTADVIRTGDRIILPDGASIPECIEVLTREHANESTKVRVKADVAVPPWDGARALVKALKEEVGFVLQEGSNFSPAAEIEIEVELGRTERIQWGTFALPAMGDKANVVCDGGYDGEGNFNFSAVVTCTKRHQARARRLLDKMREYALADSMHRGKAFSIRFYDDDGDKIGLPTPKFFPMTNSLPIFRRDLEMAIDRNVFTPIRYAEEMRVMGESLKRGVLFAGQYGTGKTMLASAIAQKAMQHGWTFIYCKDPKELPHALRYAQRYQPVVVFVEDIDRIAGLDRTAAVNGLLNQLDGIDSKAAEIMTVVTSNHPDQINSAMRRPGRIDLVLQVLPPDAETVSRMVYEFVGDALEYGTDLTEMSGVLQGLSPAYVKEACGRARLESLRRTGVVNSSITGEDLAVVSKEIKEERVLFDKKEADEESEANAFAVGLRAAARMIGKSNGGSTEERTKLMQ